jgi:hypothetical protein
VDGDAVSAHSRPSPLVTRAAVITALSVLSALLVKAGAGDVSVWLDQNSDTVAGAVLLVAPAVTAWLAKRHVTPVTDPRDNSGQKLVPAGSAPAEPDVAAAFAAAAAIAEVN